MKSTDYYIGLDMGTNSVGWAVTDEQYKLLRAKGKDMWGIREFEEASTAVDRRTHRVSRRNQQRQQVRIGLLKEYFADEILAVDPNFFIRLENSFFSKEDGDKHQDLTTKDALFAEAEYSDKDYYRDYPTIFHLKCDLINDSVPVDNRYSRKLFLALLNYYKRRGHFLNANLSGNSEGTQDVWALYKELCEHLSNEYDISLQIDESEADRFRGIMSDRTSSRTKRKESLMQLTHTDKKQVSKTLILTALCGLKVDINKIVGGESGQKAEIDFSSATLEDVLPELIASIGEEHRVLIEMMKQVYEAAVLSSVMVGVNWLSEARVRDYEKHKADLQKLKSCIRKYCDESEYDYLFREATDSSYSAYIGSTNAGGKTRRGELRKNKAGERYALMCKRIKKDLDAFKEEDSIVAGIIEDIDSENFLPKQLTFANGIIPNQLHEREMRKILDNAKKHLSFLNDVDASGLSVAERIIRLFTFHIPYYVGPLSQNYKGNGWAVRKTGMENEKIFPWNIEDVIDFSATSEEFISRMVRKCTYISSENSLPKESMIYQRYMVLNLINKLKINDELISVDLKQQIFCDLFEKGRKVSKAGIADYLRKRGYITEKSQLSGIDDNPGISLSTFARFYQIFGEDLRKDSMKDMVETIVFWGTVHGESKKMIRGLIEEKYGDILSEDQIKRIIGFKFRDWGNLSRQFLELNAWNKETGEETSLIRAMWEDNCNLMELLYTQKYTFKDSLAEKCTENLKCLAEFTYEDLQDSYFSAPVKRMVWQTLRLLQEIEHIMGCPPKRIFVEMTRSDEEKGDAGCKSSREKDLLELYKNIKEDRDWKKEITEAGGSGKLRSKKMYLYYTQMGRDMYTGEPIALEDLWDDNKYDVDHIYPRHFVKDDSVHNNLVLVDKRQNSRKSDTYPIDSKIRENSKVVGLWKGLLEKKLITEEKYRRLTGYKEFSEEQKADFIARQMVETGQATKGVNDLLKELLPKTTLVYVKAGNVSDFRRDNNFIKSRLLNDFHHAKDAYLNIVVGNVYYTKFTSNPLTFIRSGNVKYHMNRMFDSDVSRDGYTAWVASTKKEDGTSAEDGTIAIVREMMKKNSPLMTRLPLVQHGAISDATIYGKGKATAGGYLPIKASDSRLCNVERYGGFGSAKNAYFFLVEHEVPGKGKDAGKTIKVRTIESLPIYKQAQVEKSEDGLYQYCLELGLVNPSVRLKKIRPQSLLKVNGFPLYLTGKTTNRYVVRNAANLILDDEWSGIVHNIEKGAVNRIEDGAITKLFTVLLEKYTAGLYSKRPGMVGEILAKGKEHFGALSTVDKINVIEQILNLSLICNSATADLRSIGGSGTSGAGRMAKNVSQYEEVTLVNQSVTGLYEEEIDLLKV